MVSRGRAARGALARVTVAALLALPGASGEAAAQTVLDRTPLTSGGWVGTPGSLAISMPLRFSGTEHADLDVFVVPTLEGALGLPRHALVGARYAPQSPLFPGDAEWEVFARQRPLRQQDGAPLDAALQLGFNAAAASVDGELTLARWIGGLRLIGAARAFSDGFGDGGARGALAGGAVLYPRPRGLPVALAADAGAPLGREAGERMTWSGGLLIGIPYAINTLSLFATNTASGSLQGVSAGTPRTRWGMELTLPIPLGRMLGWYVPRPLAVEAVVEAPPALAPAVDARIFRHAFPEYRIEIPAGATIRWTNRDDVVHTVTADDGSWDSGAIAPGESWSATFHEPGVYPFHCGPHPYMKGSVIVR